MRGYGAIERPQAVKAAVTYTTDGRFHFITVRFRRAKVCIRRLLRALLPKRLWPSHRVLLSSLLGRIPLMRAPRRLTSTIETSSFPKLSQALPNQRRIVTSITDDELKFTNPRTPAGITLALVFSGQNDDPTVVAAFVQPCGSTDVCSDCRNDRCPRGADQRRAQRRGRLLNPNRTLTCRTVRLRPLRQNGSTDASGKLSEAIISTSMLITKGQIQGCSLVSRERRAHIDQYGDAPAALADQTGPAAVAPEHN